MVIGSALIGGRARIESAPTKFVNGESFFRIRNSASRQNRRCADRPGRNTQRFARFGPTQFRLAPVVNLGNFNSISCPCARSPQLRAIRSQIQ